MTTFINGLIISKQLGTIIAPIFDAPYTVPLTVGAAGTSGGLSPTSYMFAQGSPWPVLWNETVNQGGSVNFYNIQKLNAAILRPTAPTYVLTGFQDGLNGDSAFGGSGRNNNMYTPCYYGGFLGKIQEQTASNFLSLGIAAPLGVGATQFPMQFYKTTSDNANPNFTRSQCMRVNYQGGWAFCHIGGNGARSQMKFFLTNPIGAFIAEIQTTSGPFPNSGSDAIQKMIAIVPYTSTVFLNNTQFDIKNVLLCTTDNTGFNSLYFLDANFNTVFARYFQLDNAAAQAIFALADGTANTNIQVTEQGFIIAVRSAYNLNGFNEPVARFLIAKDASYWAPIIINRRGPIALAQNPQTWAGASVTIDPLGTLWYVQGTLKSDATQIYIGNSFGANLQLVAPVPTNNFNLPPFNLPCFTPCDIATTQG